jgi:fibronectin-binding autotransporter adhesin
MDPDAKLVEIFSTTPLTQFQFQADAVNYSIGVFSGGTVQFSGGGLTNLSVITQEIIVEPGGTLSFDDSTAGDTTIHYGNRGGTISFSDASTAGSANFENQSGGAMTFAGNSTAGNAVIANDFGTGTITFAGSSTAGSAAITNNSLGDINFNITSTAGNASITNNGSLSFNNFSTAGSATITNNNTLFFTNNSTAGNATINNNDFMHFVDNSTGGDAAITNSSGAVTDFSSGTGPAGDNRLSAGSIAGGGLFQLGANELTVGGNNMSTDVSGVIAGIGGSLVKIGTGTLTLSGSSSLSGTTIDGGTLTVVNGGSLNASDTIVVGSTAGSSGTLNIGAGGSASVWQPYLRGNLWRDWGAEANTTFSGTDLVPLASQVTRLELGGGLTGRINAAVSVFANVDYEFAVGAAENEKRNGVRGAFGAKYTW